MTPELSARMHAEREPLVAHVVAQVRRWNTPHYDTIEPQILAARVGRLVDAFVRSLDEGPVSFAMFVHELTEERIAEGYYLDEIQTVLNVLEEAMWQQVVATTPLEAQVRVLGQVSYIIGSAKDQVARVYLSHKERAEEQLKDLAEKLDQVYHGTAPAKPEFTLATR